ncbi:hypothetical protein C3K47_13210 [Solitalea longa]|uniref:Uncharacterized protein n=1 Tax=Solitalea longa TaxID=2079460 RepID=A0A2S4ZZJ4_9SPHI|nr:hypothetical protein [Solitalea longa]POY35714.1 hypothetical protein C3K47_13210 [Solitalea longa]
MHIYITTNVKQPPEKVFSQFNKALFVALQPPGLKTELLRFDGCKTGDEVHLVIKFPFFKQKWFSKITDDNCTHSCYSFTDEGFVLPFFLKKWKHVHTIKWVEDKKCTEVIDDINFEPSSFIIGLFIYPLLYSSFLYRKPIYKKYLDV